jgi:hypothetical protein
MGSVARLAVSRGRVQQSDGEHRLRPQRTPQPTVDALISDPANPKAYYERPGRYLPGQLGRCSCRRACS